MDISLEDSLQPLETDCCSSRNQGEFQYPGDDGGQSQYTSLTNMNTTFTHPIESHTSTLDDMDIVFSSSTALCM